MIIVIFICVCINIFKRYKCIYYLYIVYICFRVFDIVIVVMVIGQCFIVIGQGIVGCGMVGFIGSQINIKEEVYVCRFSDMEVEVEMILFINIGILK